MISTWISLKLKTVLFYIFNLSPCDDDVLSIVSSRYIFVLFHEFFTLRVYLLGNSSTKNAVLI